MKDLDLIKKVDTSLIYREFLQYKDKMFSDVYYAPPTHSDLLYINIREPGMKDKERYTLSTKMDFRTKAFQEDLIRSELSPGSEKYRELVLFLNAFAEERNGRLGRVTLTSLSNEYRFYPHVDIGFYYVLHDRYHLVIRSEKSHMISGEIEAYFVTGDVFYINNKVVHSGSNAKEGSERVHVFFDILPKSPFVLLWRYLVWFFVYRLKKGVGNIGFWKGLFGVRYLFEALFLSLFTYRHNE